MPVARRRVLLGASLSRAAALALAMVLVAVAALIVLDGWRSTTPWPALLVAAPFAAIFVAAAAAVLHRQAPKRGLSAARATEAHDRSGPRTRPPARRWVSAVTVVIGLLATCVFALLGLALLSANWVLYGNPLGDFIALTLFGLGPLVLAVQKVAWSR